MTTQQPAALRLANILRGIDARSRFANEKLSAASAALENQHARITELESQLAQRFDAADMATAAAQGFRDGASAPAQPVAEPAKADSVLEDALSDALRVPLDSLHADAAYLIGRLREGSMPYARVIEIIRERIDAAKAAIRARASHGQAPANPSPPEGMVGGWLPIETAPKNGTEILGYTEEVGALVLYWDSMTGEMDHWSDGMSVSFWKPTHWMHLPAAPGPADGESK